MSEAGSALILTIDGNNFSDISGFYREVNRVFMAGEDWSLGESLDAFNDMLYGGYGVLREARSVQLHWLAADKSSAELGYAETHRWLSSKLSHPETFNADAVLRQLAELEAGQGPSFFSIVLEIIAAHSDIELVRA